MTCCVSVTLDKWKTMICIRVPTSKMILIDLQYILSERI